MGERKRGKIQKKKVLEKKEKKKWGKSEKMV